MFVFELFWHTVNISMLWTELVYHSFGEGFVGRRCYSVALICTPLSDQSVSLSCLSSLLLCYDITLHCTEFYVVSFHNGRSVSELITLKQKRHVVQITLLHYTYCKPPCIDYVSKNSCSVKLEEQSQTTVLLKRRFTLTQNAIVLKFVIDASSKACDDCVSDGASTYAMQ